MNFTEWSIFHQNTVVYVINVVKGLPPLDSERPLQGRDSTQSEPENRKIADADMAFSDQKGEVLLNVQPTHPIIYDNYKLCELIRKDVCFCSA